MMVYTSVHMEYVSMRGWDIGHGSISNLPLRTTPTGHHLQPDLLPHLPYRNRGKGDHQVGSLASPGETLRHLPHESQEIQDSRKTKTKTQEPVEQPLELTSSRRSSLPSRLVVEWRRFSDASGPPYSHLAFQSKQTLQSTSPPV